MTGMDRHLTVTGFVVHKGRTALHWHRKVQSWLPAGGHIEPGEDPVQAVLREVREEFGLDAEVVPLAPRVSYAGGPEQLEPPYTILVCPVEPGHEHIDLVYFLRVTGGYPGRSHDPENPIRWVDERTLREDDGLFLAGECGPEVPFAPDVRALGLEAIRLVSQHEASLAPVTTSESPLSVAGDGAGG
jgi:8-oxo-dGTP pyrophosphatase MutT (NUDIX family)